MTIDETLRKMGYKTVDPSFYAKINEWNSWYIGNVKGFSYYRIRTGENTVRCKRYSLQMAKRIPEDWANLLMNERVKITVEGKQEQAFIDEILNRANFWVKANEAQEMKAALGTVAYIPRVVGQTLGGPAAGIELDFVAAPDIHPLGWQNGRVTACAFTSSIRAERKKYLYLQIHRPEKSGEYIIENHAFTDTEGNLRPTELHGVPGLERVPYSVRTGSTERPFVLDRLAIANNFDPGNPMGLAAFANSIDLLKGVDIAYDSYVNEFALGKKRVMVKLEAAKFLDGTPAFDPADVAYYSLPEDGVGDAVVQEIDMTLRTAEHSTGIQDLLNLLSSQCGLGQNYYRLDPTGLATATQVISENSELFRNIRKHEIILERAIVELCHIILRLGRSAMGRPLNPAAEITVDFDDSIIEDQAADFARDMQLLSAGILNDWEFRMKWLNEDEATAKAALPGADGLITEGQEDLE